MIRTYLECESLRLSSIPSLKTLLEISLKVYVRYLSHHSESLSRDIGALLGRVHRNQLTPTFLLPLGVTFAVDLDAAQGIRQKLFETALKHVGQRGWSEAALVAAARDLSLSPAIVGILPRGPGELVEHFIEGCNARCIQDLQARKEELSALPLNERVAKALQIRLQLLQPYIDSWPQALALASAPTNAPHSLKLQLSLVDDVWSALGDDSTDLSWYSKRAALVGVYTSTSLYMLTDYSPGFKDTWGALRRRVDEGLSLNARVQQAVHSTPPPRSTPPPS